jgi:transcriptional regulator with XRE-family HTH domain
MSERTPERTPRPRRSLALGMGRMAENCTQKELSETSGIPDKEISALEKKREPDREELELLFAAMGREPVEVDLALFCADLLRDPGGSLPDSPLEPTREEVRMLRVAAALEAVEVFHVTFEQLVQALRQEKAGAFRQEAGALWQELRKLSPKERWRRVEESAAYRTWAIAERTAFESAKKAADDADAAVDLARLAVRMAELAADSDAWRARAGGLCWGFLGNALRVKSDLPESERSFLRSDRLWQEGAAADPGLILDGTRLRSPGRWSRSSRLSGCRTRRSPP